MQSAGWILPTPVEVDWANTLVTLLTALLMWSGLNLVDLLLKLYVRSTECLELLKGHSHIKTGSFCYPYPSPRCNQFWSTLVQLGLPHWNGRQEVQRHFTQMIPDLNEFPYCSRLDILGLMSLHLRHFRSDLNTVFHLVMILKTLIIETFYFEGHWCYGRPCF